MFMMFRSNSQEDLLEVDWPEELLSHPLCEKLVMQGHVMFCGPRIKVGIAPGSVLQKVPSGLTGRADYFGRCSKAITHFTANAVT